MKLSTKVSRCKSCGGVVGERETFCGEKCRKSATPPIVEARRRGLLATSPLDAISFTRTFEQACKSNDLREVERAIVQFEEMGALACAMSLTKRAMHLRTKAPKKNTRLAALVALEEHAKEVIEAERAAAEPIGEVRSIDYVSSYPVECFGYDREAIKREKERMPLPHRSVFEMAMTRPQQDEPMRELAARFEQGGYPACAKLIRTKAELTFRTLRANLAIEQERAKLAQEAGRPYGFPPAPLTEEERLAKAHAAHVASIFSEAEYARMRNECKRPTPGEEIRALERELIGRRY